MGGWTAAVYTEEQQARLGVDAHGKSSPAGKVRAIGPAWTRGEIEPPAGASRPFPTGKTWEWSFDAKARLVLPIVTAALAGKKNYGTWTAAIYTKEQQQRLGVDESGKPIAYE
jgi:hypothetical protein